MRWSEWWRLLFALHALSTVQTIVPTICEEEYCRCDSFTRVICNCTTNNEVTLRPDGAYRVPTTATAIIIDGCERVQFLSETVRDLIQLRNIEVRNSNHVVINERALAWSPFNREIETNSGIRIVIHNSTISEISSHAVQGRVNDIIISDSTINNLKPFAFSSLTAVKNVELAGNTLENIDIQAFKQFTTLNFLLRGGVIRTLPSRFLSDVEVTNLFKMEDVAVKILNSLTFLVSAPKRVIIESNIIDTLEGDSFYIVTRGPITFRNNTVARMKKGVFNRFTVDRETLSVLGRQELLIDNNTVTELTPSSLMYNSTTLNLRVDGLNLNKSCTCELTEEWQAMINEQGGTIYCWYYLENHYVSLPSFVNSRCGAFKQTFWIYIVIGIIAVIVVAAIVICLVVKRENEKRKNKVQIVMPDGKTYRETEYIIMERAELLTTDL